MAAESRADLLRTITLVEKRIEEMKQFDLSKIRDRHNPELDRLAHTIDDTLANRLGQESPEYRRFRSASSFYLGPTSRFANTQPRPVRDYVKKSMETNIATMEALLSTLRERLEDMPEDDT